MNFNLNLEPGELENFLERELLKDDETTDDDDDDDEMMMPNMKHLRIITTI